MLSFSGGGRRMRFLAKRGCLATSARAKRARVKPSGLESSLWTRWRWEPATSFIVPVTRPMLAIEAKRSLYSRRLGMAYFLAFCWKGVSVSFISASSRALSSSSRTGLLRKRAS